ncbi:MAG TPA: hypothetical protein VKN18_22935 [Blastocatellia bacterium]|nr:hypothetical protein [Blastocatellia bacterium]
MKITRPLLSFFVAIALGAAMSARDKPKPDISSFDKYVIGLPSVDRVEILAVIAFPMNELKDGDCKRSDIICTGPPVRVVASKELIGADANRITRLWRKLRGGNGAGCFAPAYVLRFYRGEELLLITDVCFQCCNITLPGEGGDGIAGMCGDVTANRNFKEFVTRALPHPKQQNRPKSR